MSPLSITTSVLLVLDLVQPAAQSRTPLLPLNFPDPCIIQDTSTGTWYALASGSWMQNSTGHRFHPQASRRWNHVQVASASIPPPPSPSTSSSPPSTPPPPPTTWNWTYLPEADPLPTPGAWAHPMQGSQTWAPAVARLNDTAYVLYYAAQLAGKNAHYHCIGAATSSSPGKGGILGPYDPLPRPVVCPLHAGGAIDPAAFRDPATGRRYLLYKVDGNSMGRGGECNNGVAPFMRTPIVLQEVDARDGVTAVGDGVEVLDRDWEMDGPLVEAPDLVYLDRGFGEGGREGSVNYAVAGNITGPYERPKGTGPLIKTGDGFDVTAPGGAAAAPDSGWMLFHGHCPHGRCLFGAVLKVKSEYDHSDDLVDWLGACLLVLW
ncbi:glycoside hydrolase family 43 protein [Parathielavia hyrcaniae]|uniref:Glycoside hydrolase family 43 protein n=1 Tax=Parathielavia hyrcaniae TaxID=113614 RepID=A0AAN6Q1Q3_9PEZI|nr:glycoside hydrolase family 43 protein [Parathielavia hyrcaniae]